MSKLTFILEKINLSIPIVLVVERRITSITIEFQEQFSQLFILA